MRKLNIVFIIISVTLFSFNIAVDHVYICDSKTAKKYHYKKDCRGLNACKAEIVKITLSDALDSKRTLCGWED